MAAEIIKIQKNGIVQYPITKSECVLDNEGKTITEVLLNKVDKEEGKGLSTNDYTDAEREKLAGLNNYDDTKIKVQLREVLESCCPLDFGEDFNTDFTIDL